MVNHAQDGAPNNIPRTAAVTSYASSRLCSHLELGAEVPELLVADGLDGAGVNRTAGVCTRQRKRVLSYHCLAGRGVRCNKHLREMAAHAQPFDHKADIQLNSTPPNR